ARLLSMPLAEAVALHPELHVEPSDPRKDGEALGRLAEWSGRYSPMVALEEIGWLAPLDPRRPALPAPRSLLLDITGCAACFQGEAKLLERVVRELREQGWVACVAIADTVGSAWGLARYGKTPVLIAPGQTQKGIDPLPVAALRLPADIVGS